LIRPQRGQRTWDDTISKEDKVALDYSAKFGQPKEPSTTEEEAYQTGPIDLDNWEEQIEDEEEEEEEEGKPSASNTSTPKSGGGLFSFLKNFSVNKPLEASDLAPVLAKFKEHLISKNVASDIAEKLCESVSVSLEGKKLGTFGSVKNTVRGALEESLVRILTPKRNIDILRDAQEAKAKGRPYCITFCGVNGVGKSTNLAKICAWLQQNNLQVLIAACDTFRSGAVEQLNVHCRRLGVELYERGYKTDPAAIALDALKAAKPRGKDVVLIDTAGRMQDNAPQMQALAKVILEVKHLLIVLSW
jgi:signal recognition particle receptor subunit alpha